MSDPPPEVPNRGGRSRGGRRRVVLALVGVVGVGVPAVAVLAGDNDPARRLTVGADGGGPASESISDPLALPAIEPVPPPTVAPPAALPPVDIAAPAVAATVPPSPTMTTAPPLAAPVPPPNTDLPCRNSFDIACGPFRWDPAPAADLPLVAAFVAPPVTAEAGKTVVFEVAWSDGDATLAESLLSTDSAVLATPCSMTARYGPWTPPEARPSSGTKRYEHTFPTAGTYRVTVFLTSSDCTSPYSSDASVETTVVVT